jgi:EAL domain-containing protein (putative c-di-GMP-specific phosphodiesterase class I)
MKLKVTAEGVETEGQLQFLRRHRCDQGQGFLLGRPVPAAKFEELLRRSPAAGGILFERDARA